MRKYDKREMDYFGAKEKALRLLEYRNHSKKELERKLKLAGAQDGDIKKVIEFLEEYSLINDRDYAKRLALDLQNLKKYGKRRIYSELAQRGIEPEYIEEAINELAEFDFDEFLEMVKKRIKGDFEKKNKDRVIRYFLNKGYSFDQIREAVSELENNFS